MDCSSLTSISIPRSVTSIESSAFNSCIGLTTIVVEEGNAKYDSRNNCNAIIETSSNTLIVGCKNTTIPNSVRSIGSSAFLGISGLTYITIPNGVTSIGSGAFYQCSSLSSVNIPNSVKNIGGSAFYACISLTSITIPNSVTSIGGWAFYGCIDLNSVIVLNPTPVAISIDVFTNRENATLYVPKGSTDAYQTANYWKAFKEIIEIDETGIDQIMNDKHNKATIFTLDGKRINRPQKGINIIGGKKVVVK
jgi:hypothetical protein